MSATYLPLPKNVTIKQSPIHGLGMFATEDIAAGFDYGITHVKDDRFQDGYIRTPLGGFINFSKIPNCEFIEFDGGFTFRTIKDIKSGEELTADYPLYKPE